MKRADVTALFREAVTQRDRAMEAHCELKNAIEYFLGRECDSDKLWSLINAGGNAVAGLSERARLARLRAILSKFIAAS